MLIAYARDSAPSFRLVKCSHIVNILAICDQTKQLICKISLSRDLASSYYLGIAIPRVHKYRANYVVQSSVYNSWLHRIASYIAIYARLLS